MNVLSELQNLFESFKCRSGVDVDLIKPISEIEKLPVKNASRFTDLHSVCKKFNKIKHIFG